MSHRSRWSRLPVDTKARRFALIPLVVAVLWLALAGTALANYSTSPGWYWLNPIPASEHGGVDVAMFGDDAWMTGSGHDLRYSTDSGRTWLLRDTDTRHVDDLTFVSPTIGWGVASADGVNGERVVRTTDGGRTWASVLQDPDYAINDLFCLDATHAWAQISVYGMPESCYRTTDAGATWSTSTTPCLFEEAAFTSATEGWSVGNIEVTPSPHLTSIGTIYHTTDAGVTWSSAWSGDIYEALYSIVAPDASHIVAGGVNGGAFIVRSADHGSTWSSTHPVTGIYGEHVDRLVFRDGMHGWAVSGEPQQYPSYGTLLDTTDGGLTWGILSTHYYPGLACNTAGDVVACGDDTRVAAPSGSPLASVDPSSFTDSRLISGLYFSDGERGWGVSGSQKVLRTTNAGARWDEIALPFLSQIQKLKAICAQPPSGLWVVGDYGTMCRSTDDGATWAPVDSTTSQHLTDITFADADTGWAAGGGSLLSTVDGGQSWNPSYMNGDHTWSGVACASATTVCAAGLDNIAGRGCVVRTTNGGETWRQVLTSATTHTMVDVGFWNAPVGWAWGGFPAVLYRTTNSGATWTPCDLSGCLSTLERSQLLIRDVDFAGASTGYVTCELNTGTGAKLGYLLKTMDGGTTWVKVGPTTPPESGPSVAMTTVATSGDRVWLGGYASSVVANFDPDPDPPATTESYDGRWSNQAVTLNFSATDPGVGVAYTRYRRWPDPWVYGDSVTVPAPGDHSHDGVWPVQYQSVDWLAQAESPHTRLVKIDTAAPTDPGVTLSPDPALAGGFVGPDPTFRFRGLDSALASGVRADSSMTAVAVAGPYAYVGDGDSLVVFDVSNPWQPQYVSDVGVHGAISDVAVAGDLACVALGPDGLITVDVSDPEHPEVVGSCAIEGDASRVSRDGEFAYVATGKGGVAVVVVHDPTHPQVVATLKVEGATDVAADGDRLCVATGAGLTAFDLSTPDEPAETGSCALHHGALGVDLRDGLACVAAGTDGAYLIEAEGEAPEVLADLDVHGDVTTAALTEGLATVAGDEGAAVLDVSDPAEPVLAGTIATSGRPLALAAGGEYLYAAEGSDGVEIWKAMATEAASYLVDHAPGTVPDTVAESGVSSASFSGLAGGPAYFHVRTRDQAGNWGAPVAVAFTVDAVGPGVTTNADDVLRRHFTLLLSADDGAGSGVAAVEFRIDGGVWRTGTSVTFSGVIKRKNFHQRGVHIVEYRATDRVGNVGPVGSCRVRIG